MRTAWLLLRKGGAPRGLHLPHGQDHFATAHRKGAVAKIIDQGRTDLLDKFISKKGRPFKAFLVLGPEKKVGFEFEPRDTCAKNRRRTKGRAGSKWAK
jgi:DNA topoisomerase III